ncbi:MAG TPA: hypothetical protein VGQ81_06080 [Acidobacteriota bacterium]|jgi:hypothetical protein|nr:hypothetical protein [Acidobacteriota bacterium]
MNQSAIRDLQSANEGIATEIRNRQFAIRNQKNPQSAIHNQSNPESKQSAIRNSQSAIKVQS